uniref:Amine oxidase n=1 Tax=Strigamia maritima TaxID=126957 RepID=T1IXY1_STRMM
MDTCLDVIVVGAGLSGLSAAYKLKKVDSSCKIIILEAKFRVGGRTLSHRLRCANHRTDLWDLGGQWVSSTQPHITALIKDLNIETYPQFLEGNKLLQLQKNKITSYNSWIPDISFWAAIELFRFIQKLETLAQEINVKNPYLHPRAEELDGMTFESYKNKHLRCYESRQLIDIAFRTTFGFDPCNMSCLYVLMYGNAAGGILRLFEGTEGAAQQLRVKGGTQQISFKLMDKLGAENVLLNHAVTEIIQREESNLVIVNTTNGKTFHATKLILAIPVHEALRIKFCPLLPEPKRLLFQNMPVGHLTKFICTYETTFWRAKNLSGEIVTNGGAPIVAGCDTGPLGIVYDGTTHNGNPALVGFISGHVGVQWSLKTPMERKAAVLQCLAIFFGNDALEPIDYAEKVWSEEPYNGGCPVNVMVPGVMKYVPKDFRKPYGKIHFAGTETSTSWCGYMNGAVQAGFRAAKEVLHDQVPGSIDEKELADTAYAKPNFDDDEDNLVDNTTSRLLAFAQLALGIAIITSVGIF